jgi:hypothetical protein
MKQIASIEAMSQLRPAERAALADFVSRLQARFAPSVLHLILFGSRARGQGDPESDLDLLIVVDDDDWRLHDAIADESVAPGLTHGVLISPVIVDKTQYIQIRHWRTLFYRNLEQDGVELWTMKPMAI